MIGDIGKAMVAVNHDQGLRAGAIAPSREKAFLNHCDAFVPSSACGPPYPMFPFLARYTLAKWLKRRDLG